MSNLWKNQLYNGDNRGILRHYMRDENVDRIYLKRILLSTTSLCLLVLWVALAASGEGRAQAPVTFSNQVIRIMQNNCQVCHHVGGVGPFPLTTYEEAFPYAQSIKNAVVSRRMPDGPAVRLDTGCADADTFEGLRRLTQAEIDTLVQWVEGGAPEGDSADLPPSRTFEHRGEWKGGTPDLMIANAPEGFAVPPNLRRDVFRRFSIPNDSGVDRYLIGFEALPGVVGNSDHGLKQSDGAGELHHDLHRVVHHVTLWIDPEGRSLEQERAFAAANPEVPGPGFEGDFTYPTTLVGMWFPGSEPIRLPEGSGVRVPRGGRFVFEVHYATYHRVAVMDRTLVGLKFARAPIYRERAAVLVKNENFTIPAGDSRYQVHATWTAAEDVTVYSVTPHMHQIGTDFQAEAELPGGGRLCLFDVEWAFKHQNTYVYKRPLNLPAGTRVHTSCQYNNTEGNPSQINFPPINIPFGKTADMEMCQLTLGLTRDQQWLTPSSPAIQTVRVAQTQLILRGRDLREGAIIEINGELIRDTQLSGNKAYAFSARDWQAVCPEGVRAEVVVINPDGGRSASVTFFPSSDDTLQGRGKPSRDLP